MRLQPNYTRVATEALPATLRRLLAQEPKGAHSITDCWSPTCSGCQEWKAWAREVRELNHEIETRPAR